MTDRDFIDTDELKRFVEEYEAFQAGSTKTSGDYAGSVSNEEKRIHIEFKDIYRLTTEPTTWKNVLR